MPLIVASLVEGSISGASNSSKAAFGAGADLVELRLDHLEGFNIHMIREARREILGPTIATLRSKGQGGRSALAGSNREDALKEIIESDFEYVDIELDTDNPDEFEFVCGCIRLRIKSVQKTTLDEWIKTQITLHSISDLPDELMTTSITGSAADLLEACKVLTSYTTDLLYRLDNQINLGDVEEIQQAKNAIAKYTSVVTKEM